MDCLRIAAAAAKRRAGVQLGESKGECTVSGAYSAQNWHFIHFKTMDKTEVDHVLGQMDQFKAEKELQHIAKLTAKNKYSGLKRQEKMAPRL